MKKMNFTYVMIGLLLLAACKKNDCDIPVPPGIEKEYMLKKVVHGTRQYLFYFNKKNVLDSIGVEDAKVREVYRIIRRNNRIDSVIYIRNGSPYWVSTDMEYNSDGNITRFRIHDRGPAPAPVVMTYNQGHLHSITRYDMYLSFLTSYDTVTYNQQNNIFRWSSVIPRSTFLDVKWYTYDNRLNPLYFIDDLLIVFARGGITPEFYLSQHNSTSIFYELYNITVNYHNYYDNKQRLIKKVFAGRFSQQPDSLTFHYVR
jgi:hypothetical protein